MARKETVSQTGTSHQSNDQSVGPASYCRFVQASYMDRTCRPHCTAKASLMTPHWVGSGSAGAATDSDLLRPQNEAQVAVRFLTPFHLKIYFVVVAIIRHCSIADVVLIHVLLQE